MADLEYLDGNTRLQRARGDGDCLFHAAAFALHKLRGLKLDGPAIRAHLVAKLKMEGNIMLGGTTLLDWLDWECPAENYTLESYLQRLEASSFWGGRLKLG